MQQMGAKPDFLEPLLPLSMEEVLSPLGAPIPGVVKAYWSHDYGGGVVYRGAYSQGVPHGQGRVHIKKRFVIDGTWVEGKLHGAATLTRSPNTQTVGASQIDGRFKHNVYYDGKCLSKTNKKEFGMVLSRKRSTSSDTIEDQPTVGGTLVYKSTESVGSFKWRRIVLQQPNGTETPFGYIHVLINKKQF